MDRAGVRMTGRLAFGLIVIALGVIFSLGNLGLLEPDAVLRWWPSLLIAAGVYRLIGVGCAPRVMSGLVFTVFGSALLLHNLGVIRRDPWDFWPLGLVLIGIGLVARGLTQQRGGGAQDDPSSRLNGFAMWSGLVRKVTAPDFTGGDLVAFMGGHVIDLRSARIAGESAALEVFVMWGGIELRVPEDWAVSVEVLPFMGGVDDRSRTPAGPVRGRLVIKGLVIMGGVEVKN